MALSIFSKNKGNEQLVSIEKSLKAFFDRYNCNYEVEEVKDQSVIRYFFDFQGGHYVAFLHKAISVVEVIFPSIIDVPINRLSAVRSCCNRSNALSIYYKFLYSVDEETNQVDVNISSFVNVIDFEDFKALLEGFFEEQRDFIEMLNNTSSEAEEADTDDIEQHMARNKRELFLMRQQEFKSQDASLQWRPNDLEHLTLGQFFCAMQGKTGVQFKRLQVITSGLEVVEGHDDIAGIDLSSFLISGTGHQAAFVRDQAVVVLHFTTPLVSEDEESVMTLNFRQAGRDESSLYYRITAFLEADAVSRRHSCGSAADEVFPGAVTVLVAFDFATDIKRQQEFDYMWKDAKIKINEGKSSELSEEQQLIFDVTDANVAYCLYWGRHFMGQKRYYQAILYLENAFNALRLSYFKLSKDVKKSFFKVCYYIGFCYCDLRLYEKAFYYLDIISDLGRIDFAMEFVNVLANSSDMRIFNVINHIMQDIREHYDEEDELPEKIKNFINFLRRRRAYAFINFGKLDEAEKEFKAMLDEPENCDYAIDELAFIQLQRDSLKADENPEEK